MATLKSLVDETTNIKNEIVNCYDNLKNNLSNKGVEIELSDKLPNLIEKVSDLNTLEVGVYSTLPNRVPQEGLAIITDIIPNKIHISYKKPEIANGDIWIKIMKDEYFSYTYTYKAGNINIPLDIFNVYQAKNSVLDVIPSYVAKNGAWELLFEPHKMIYDAGTFIGEFSNCKWEQTYSRNSAYGNSTLTHGDDGIYIYHKPHSSSSTSGGQLGGNYCLSERIMPSSYSGYSSLKIDIDIITHANIWGNVVTNYNRPSSSSLANNSNDYYLFDGYGSGDSVTFTCDLLPNGLIPWIYYYTPNGKTLHYVIRRIYFERSSTYLSDEEVRIAELEEENELLRQELLITKNMINELTLNNAKEIDNIIE